MSYILRVTLLSVFAALFMLLLAGLSFAVYSERILTDISAGVIRFHVLANSDSPEDQALKLAVRDGVLEGISYILTGDETPDEARSIINNNLSEIESIASGVIRSLGYDYPVRAALAADYFPTRVYSSAALPAGVYQALRLTIGDGGGRNWWCVMFPPLCFTDAAVTRMPNEEENEEPANPLENVLTAESLDIVSGADTVHIKFKVVELWQGFKHWLSNVTGQGA